MHLLTKTGTSGFKKIGRCRIAFSGRLKLRIEGDTTLPQVKFVDVGSEEDASVRNMGPNGYEKVRIQQPRSQKWLTLEFGEEAVLTSGEWFLCAFGSETIDHLTETTKECTCGTQGRGICSSWCDSW